MQKECHHGNPNVSLEDCAVRFLPPGSNEPQREFFTCLSDSKQHDVSTTHWRMTHLVKHLKEKNVLKKNGLIPCNSDGRTGKTVAV